MSMEKGRGPNVWVVEISFPIHAPTTNHHHYLFLLMSPGATQIACTVSTISPDPFVLAINGIIVPV